MILRIVRYYILEAVMRGKAWHHLTCVLGCALFFSGVPAAAQTQLDTIVVKSPTPVQSRPPSPAPVETQSVPAPTPTESPNPERPLVSPNFSFDPTYFAITVLTPAETLSQSSHTLGEALANQPGITTTSFAPAASRPVIRGLSGFRVRIQENGIGTHDVSALSDDHGVPIDPLTAGQIEVIRGPAILRYGSQAIGGLVSANNSRIPEERLANGWRIENRGGLRSVDDGADGATIVEASIGNFVVHADMWKRTANDYRIPSELKRQPNSSLDADGYSLGGSFVTDNGFIGVSLTSYASRYFIPGEEAAANKVNIDLQQMKLSSKGELRPKSNGVEAVRYWLGYTDYTHDEIDLGTVSTTFKNREVESRVEVEHQAVMTVAGLLKGALGVQYSHRNLEAGGEEGQLLLPTKTESLAGYLFEELRLTSAVRLQAAGRLERTEIEGTASFFPPSFLPPPNDPTEESARRLYLPRSASLGLLVDLPLGVVMRLTGQHVERSPDATELFYRGPHEATATFEIGNPDLRLEKADTLEIGFKRSKGEFRFDASLFHTRFRDFIYKRYTGAKCDGDFASCGVGTEFDQIVYDQRNATFTGFELLAEQDIAKVWNGVWGVEGRYDFVRAKFEDGTNVPKIPPHRLGGGLFYRDRSLLARISLLHAFRQDEIASFETSTSGYNLLNAELSYTLKREGREALPFEMTVGIKGENLLDDDIRNHVSYKKDEVLQPGRSVRLFGVIKLN